MSIFQDLTDVSIHFSKTIGTKICFENGKRAGKLVDFFVDYNEMYPRVIALLFKNYNKHYYIEWKNVKYFSFKKIIVSEQSFINEGNTYKKEINTLESKNILKSQYKKNLYHFSALGQIVLDRQIVDTYGKKVVRVNDIQFIKTGKNLRVTHAAIGYRSMMRRLGFEPFIDFINRLIFPKSKILHKAKLINWKYVHTLPDRNRSSHLTLSLTDADIKSIHPADLADILEDIDVNAREAIFSELTPELAAETLSEVEYDLQASFIKNGSDENAAKIIENMGTDEAADLLGELGNRRAHEIISKIEDAETSEEIKELLEYEEDSAGGLMSTEVFEITAQFKKSDIIRSIQNEFDEFETIYDLYIVNEGKLIGTCPLSKVLIQKEDIIISDIMTSNDIKSLTPDTSWKEVASYMSKYNLINVPIIDNQKQLLGIISVDDVLPWLLKER